jgi:hypothetical protein
LRVIKRSIEIATTVIEQSKIGHINQPPETKI